MNKCLEIEARIRQAEADNDIEAIQLILEELYQEIDTAPRPYDAAIELKPEFAGELQPEGLESNAVISLANRLARIKRAISYRLKTTGGFSGLQIVSEGDSWFQYPWKLKDIIDWISEEQDIAVRSLGAAGDLVEHMAIRREYDAALRQSGAPIMLLSGGGNDLLGDGRLSRLLRKYRKGSKAKNLINYNALEQVKTGILTYYKTILNDVGNNHPDVKVFGHGYDLPAMNTKGGWFSEPFKTAGIPENLGGKIISIILNSFSEALIEVASENSNFEFVDLRGVVGNHPNDWYDELHPQNLGFGRAAKSMLNAIRKHADGLPHTQLETSRKTVPLGIGASEFESGVNSNKVVVLDPGHGGTVNNSSSSNNATGPAGTLEKNWTLDVCKRAKSLLLGRGYVVHLTREGDTNPTLAARRKTAREAGADCFISIHFNASNTHQAQGTETFVHSSNATSQKSILLMHIIQGEMVAELGHRDRNRHNGANGILKAGYGVIKPSGHLSDTAAVLHEVSFMDRVDEESRIMRATYRNRIADAIARSADAYFAGGFELSRSVSDDLEIELEDSIHARAKQLGLSSQEYLGMPEPQIFDASADRMVGAQGDDDVSLGDGNLDTVGSLHLGGNLIAAEETDFDQNAGRKLSIVSQMLQEKTRFEQGESVETEIADANEDQLLEDFSGMDLSRLGQNPSADRALLEANFQGLESSGFNYAEFAQFIDGLGLRYFTPREFLVLGNRNKSAPCKGANYPPEKALWSNIANTALMIDEIRHRLGAPITILSAYRSPEYNTCIGGASNSYHKEFNALDWYCTDWSLDDCYSIARAVRQSDNRFIGGIGKYASSNFIHIDTRRTKVDF